MDSIQKILKKQDDIDLIEREIAIIRSQIDDELSVLMSKFNCLELDFDEVSDGYYKLYSVMNIPVSSFPSSLEFSEVHIAVLKNDKEAIEEMIDYDENYVSLVYSLTKHNIEPEDLYDFIYLASMVEFPKNTMEKAAWKLLKIGNARNVRKRWSYFGASCHMVITPEKTTNVNIVKLVLINYGKKVLRKNPD